jgi:hypothetical protein
MTNEKRIIYESHNQRKFIDERRFNDRIMGYVFSSGLLTIACLICYGKMHYNDVKHSDQNRSFTNRMERILK